MNPKKHLTPIYPKMLLKLHQIWKYIVSLSQFWVNQLLKKNTNGKVSCLPPGYWRPLLITDLVSVATEEKVYISFIFHFVLKDYIIDDLTDQLFIDSIIDLFIYPFIYVSFHFIIYLLILWLFCLFIRFFIYFVAHCLRLSPYISNLVTVNSRSNITLH